MGVAERAVVVDGGAASCAVAYELSSAGIQVTLVERETVTGIRHADRRVTGVAFADGDLPRDVLVVAMGPWIGAAGDWLDCPLPIEPLKGEIVRVAPAGPPLACDVVAPSVSLFGCADGQVWIGATQERRGFDTRPSESAYRTLVGSAVRLMPALAEARPVRQTACLRPVAPDGLPVVGKVPGWEGVYVATGGGPKGILPAPAMGLAVAELIRTGRTSLPVAACAPERFL